MVAGKNASQAVFPEDPAYDEARRVWNTRFNPFPAAVFYAHDKDEVAAATSCAYHWGFKVSPAAGRQSFQGWTIPAGYLVVDITNLTQAAFSPDNTTVSIGSGMTGSMVQAAVFKSGIPGAAVSTGYCAFVGAAGWLLGGGFGLLGRYIGLGCDQVVGLEMVMFNGTIVTANATHNPDLLWAYCGSGGGTFGIVTEFTLELTMLPDEGRVTAIELKYQPNPEASGYAWWLFQEALPTLDKRFGFTFSLIGGQMGLIGVFLGKPAEAASLLNATGLLDPDLLDYTIYHDATSSDEALLAVYPYGAKFQAKDSYMDIVIEDIINQWTAPVMGMSTPWDEGWVGAPEQVAFLNDLLSGENHVVGGAGYNAFLNIQARLVGQLPEEGIAAVLDFTAQLGAECAASNYSSPACLGGVTGHVLGGAYADKASDSSAYPHRDKYFIMDGGMQAPSDLVAFMPADVVAEALGFSDRFLTAIKPFLGEQEATYVNYLQPAVANWQTAYFGDNYQRLQRVKGKYDPLGVFSKPYTVEVPETA